MRGGNRLTQPQPGLSTVLTTVVDVEMGGTAITDITGEAARFVRGAGDGLLSVFAPHATAGVALMETGADSEPDLLEALERLLPRDARYRHRHGSPGHGADHLLPALVSPSLTIPVAAGRMLLGTWQRVVLVSLNRDNPHRQVRLSFVEG
jgi:secondary thiamine-phosphate synthase enzyme